MSIWLFTSAWPQLRTTSGFRTFSFLESFIKDRRITHVFSSTPKTKKEMTDIKAYLSLYTHSINPNNEAEADKVLRKTKDKPEIAIFNSFSAEQMFSSMIHKNYPECLQVLSIEQFSSLKNKRQEIFEKNGKLDYNVLNAFPQIRENEYTTQEIASFYRSDLVLFMSDYEQMKVKETFQIENTGCLPFFYDEKEIDTPIHSNFMRRNNFFWMGDCSDPAYLDSLNWTINEIWPKILQEIPEAKLHLYGSNFPDELKEKEFSSIKFVEEIDNMKRLIKYKILLLPFRFGAGIKSEISDAWLYGVPVVTTPIGAEGMFESTFDNNIEYKKIDIGGRFYSDANEVNGIPEQNSDVLNYYDYSPDTISMSKILDFGGIAHDLNSDGIARSAVELYKNKDLWYECQVKGKNILTERMSFLRNHGLFMKLLADAQRGLITSRRKNTKQASMWSESIKMDKLSKHINLNPKVLIKGNKRKF